MAKMNLNKRLLFSVALTLFIFDFDIYNNIDGDYNNLGKTKSCFNRYKVILKSSANKVVAF